MTPLEAALVDRIKADGPIGVEAWMDACNAYYYATRDPLGAHGDFTTAPEISQMYGELIGAALADAWSRAGRPAEVRYAELGPGRGTLAADALRTMHAAGCEPASVEFVETSPVLRGRQAVAVPGATFHDSIDALADRDGPLLLDSDHAWILSATSADRLTFVAAVRGISSTTSTVFGTLYAANRCFA